MPRLLENIRLLLIHFHRDKLAGHLGKGAGDQPRLFRIRTRHGDIQNARIGRVGNGNHAAQLAVAVVQPQLLNHPVLNMPVVKDLLVVLRQIVADLKIRQVDGGILGIHHIQLRCALVHRGSDVEGVNAHYQRPDHRADRHQQPVIQNPVQHLYQVDGDFLIRGLRALDGNDLRRFFLSAFPCHGILPHFTLPPAGTSRPAPNW